MAENLIILCLLAGSAALLPFLSRNFSVPSAVLEILFGMLLFNTVIGHAPEWFHFLKELGFIYLMFIAGMELDVRELMKSTKVFSYLLIPSLAFLVIPLILVVIGYSFYTGVALSMVSAGIVVPVLKETGRERSASGRHIINVALAGELVSIMILTGLDIYHRYGVSLLMLLNVAKLVGLLLLAFVTLRTIYLLAWWNPAQVRKVMESNDPVEEGIRIAIAIVSAGALLAYGAGLEPIMGSFIAGAIFTAVFRNRSRFEEKINALGFGFFVPLFFIGVGAEFDISLLLSAGNILTALVMTGIIFVSNLPALLLRKSLGMSRREGFLMALLLSAPLSMIVVAGTLGERMALIDSNMKNIFILAALFASLFYPFAFRMFSAELPEADSTAKPS